MANRTASYANTVHGTNPQYLIEKIIRTRIYDSKYWKEHCTLLNSALVLEKAVDDLRYIGGVFGGHTKPTPFLCLTQKLLQIQPQKEIVYLFVDQPDFKYLRALGAFYLRLTSNSVEVYTKLEPLFKDYRKLRFVDRNHQFSIIHMDELIDNLLREQRVFDVILPRLTKRSVLEENGDLLPYKSELEEQNLVPLQMIEEKVEQHVEEERRLAYRKDSDRYPTDSSGRRHDSRIDHSRRYDDSRNRRYDDSYNRHHRHDNRRHDDRGSKSYEYKHSRQPNKSRFSQEEIDNENAIREKLGLKPLR